MQLVQPSFEIIEQETGLNGIYKHIELAGRTCYKSLDKITENSAKEFVDRMIKNNHCYTGDSEVLTINGWIKWCDYNGEKVAVVNSNRTFKGYETPTRIIKYQYTGNFYEFPELGLKVTDGHNMFGMFRDSKHNFYNENLYELFSCKTNYEDNNGNKKTLGERTFKVPTNCICPITTDPFYELIGFWLGDGCGNKQIVNKLVFHLKKERKIKYLKQLCLDCGYTFEEVKANYFKVNSPNIGRLFMSKYYKNGVKVIEDSLNPIQIHSIIQGLINSDGSLGTNTRTITFTNTSKSIIDWIIQYGPIAGYNITDCGISTYTNSHKPVYKILLKDTQYIINNDSRKKDKKVIISSDNLDVYCVTVSTGLILVRGVNGQTSICGNCAMLEHGTVYLKYESELVRGIQECDTKFYKYKNNKFSIYNTSRIEKRNNTIMGGYVTTNLRVLVENNWLDDLEYLCEPTEYHEKRITVKFVSDIHFYKDTTRHRVFSWAIESTRFCNYMKEKFGSSVSFLTPIWLKSEEQEEFENDLKTIEDIYFKWINKGWQAQQAAYFLIQGTKAEIIMTGFISDYEHFFNLRSDVAQTGKAHPTVVELVEPLRQEFIKRNLIK